GRGADGRSDSGGGGNRWTDAADAGAHLARAAGGSAVDCGVFEQVRRGGGSGAAGAGGAGGTGVAEDVSVSRGHDSGDQGIGAEGPGRRREVGEVDPGADGRGGQAHTLAAAGSGQAVCDADRGYFFDFRARDGGDGTD